MKADPWKADPCASSGRNLDLGGKIASLRSVVAVARRHPTPCFRNQSARSTCGAIDCVAITMRLQLYCPEVAGSTALGENAMGTTERRGTAVRIASCFFGGSGPLGAVTHYFVRIEYQKRGTQHFHMLLWVAGAPKEKDTWEDKKKFIDEHIAARLPDAVEEPDLHELVSDNLIRVVRHVCDT
uniref:Helitron_like_N domain-containing protein n=1 Tax=Steinernema glaseri TaxID=37863 RepID=A0A1I7YKS7_9BILA